MLNNRPPMGIAPEWLYEESRCRSLINCLDNYMDNGFYRIDQMIEMAEELAKRLRRRAVILPTSAGTL